LASRQAEHSAGDEIAVASVMSASAKGGIAARLTARRIRF